MGKKGTDLGTSPFLYKGGPSGCLLIHGFTGTPLEMEYMGRALHARGMTVSGAQLAGHGTTPQDMNLTGWRDWYKSAEDGLMDLNARCRETFVAGLSMGGALTLLLSARHPRRIRAAAAMAPAAVIRTPGTCLAPLIARFMPYFSPPDLVDLTDKEAVHTISSYNPLPLRCVGELRALTAEVRDSLPEITIPLLALQGMKDKTLWPGNAKYVYDRAGSRMKTLRLFHNSGHGVTIDLEKDAVVDEVYNHFRKFSSYLN